MGPENKPHSVFLLQESLTSTLFVSSSVQLPNPDVKPTIQMLDVNPIQSNLETPCPNSDDRAIVDVKFSAHSKDFEQR
jgi:hypothetical protein